MFAENTAVFLREFGVPCQCGMYAFKGILNLPDDTLNMAGVNVLSTMYELIVQNSDVLGGSLASGVNITVNGVAYVIRDVLSVDDGVFNHITLSK